MLDLLGDVVNFEIWFAERERMEDFRMAVNTSWKNEDFKNGLLKEN